MPFRVGANGVNHMNSRFNAALLPALALTLIAGPGLSSCSKASSENADATAPAGPAASTPATTAEAVPGNDESTANAKALLKSMSDYLASQKSISLAYDSIFEVVSADHQKFQIATSGTVDMTRPDKIRTTRKSGFSDTEMVFDGKTLSFLGKGKNAYLQTEVPGTIDNLVAQLRDKFHRQLPGADLLSANVYDELMTGVTNVKDLGSGVIDGQECDHLAFRAKEADWQIWIAQGATPRPCRYVITSTGVDQAPQFSMTIRDWKSSTAAGPASFAFTPPQGATKIDASDMDSIKETSDLPENYRVGGSQ